MRTGVAALGGPSRGVSAVGARWARRWLFPGFCSASGRLACPHRAGPEARGPHWLMSSDSPALTAKAYPRHLQRAFLHRASLVSLS